MNKISELIGWLCYHKVCCGCNQLTHVAPLTMFARDLMEWTSHGLCPACERKFIDDLHEIESGNALTTTAAEHDTFHQGRWTGKNPA